VTRRGLLAALLGGAAAPGPEGETTALTDGRLFVPAGFRPGARDVPLTLHLHGAHGVAARNHLRAGSPGVLVSVVLPGLSAVYTERFRDPTALRRVLGEARDLLRRRYAADLEPGPLTVTSFSAGFGGVRELLRDAEAFDRIETLVMADSLYAGFTGDPAARRVHPEHMAGFLRFAGEAAAGRKRFVLTCTRLHTPTYASTGETAGYLREHLGLPLREAGETWPGGLALLARAERGGCRLLFFAGETGPEHMRHLHELWRFLRVARRPS